VLFYGPTVREQQANGLEISFINSHSGEFEPVDVSTPESMEGAPGKSQVWGHQKWIDASLADFQQFDAIVISDLETHHPLTKPEWAVALASRAIWGSAISGNIFITAGDPVSDASLGGQPSARVFRQGLRFAATQAGNSHGRTGLYLATGHVVPGVDLNGVPNSTEIDLLSWFGSFRAIGIQQPGPIRLVTANPVLNVLENNLNGWQDEFEVPGFHSWPNGYYPIAQRLSDPNPTPTNTFGYWFPCEADTGYEFDCAGPRPLVYMLAKPVNASELTRLVASQCNIARPIGTVLVPGSVSFSAYSTIAPVPDPFSTAAPSIKVSWRVVSGPHAGLAGRCTRQFNNGIPTGIWNASYNCVPANITTANFQDVVQLFHDWNDDMIFNDMSNSADPMDPNDPAPGVTIEYGTTFTVNSHPRYRPMATPSRNWTMLITSV